MTQIRPFPSRRPVLGRETVLGEVLNRDRLPILPAIALRLVAAASRSDCRIAEIVSLLAQDPMLCAKLLKAVNSSSSALHTKPVSSIERAVVVVGLNKLRSLALSLSLPAMRPRAQPDFTVRAHSLSSVGGAIFARELAIRLRYPTPEDDLVAGLMRDLGSILIRQAFPDVWSAMMSKKADPLEENQCEREREAFGVDHAEIGAEVLRSWNLADDVVLPIRYHHQPEKLDQAEPSHATRAYLLWFAGLLTKVHTLIDHPFELDRVLSISEDRFGMPRADLADFLQSVWPKIDEYSRLLSQDVGSCPDYNAIFKAGREELFRLRESHADNRA